MITRGMIFLSSHRLYWHCSNMELNLNSQMPRAGKYALRFGLWIHSVEMLSVPHLVVLSLTRRSLLTYLVFRTPKDFASASDKVWPLFQALGLRKTPKHILNQMGILRKVNFANRHPLV